MPTEYRGGCLCGAIRYVATGAPDAIALCHCATCRRASGAPIVSWATFPLASLRWDGEPARYPSSPGVERGFCARCGTPLSFTAGFMPGLVDLTVCSLDDPALLPPQMHIWESRHLAWLVLGDTLPRHAEAPPRS